MRRTKKKRRIENIKHHASTRAQERFGGLYKDDFEKIIAIIQSKQATFVKKTSNRVSVFSLTYNGLEMTVVYDKKRKLIVTVY